jgi:hypothetical protein
MLYSTIVGAGVAAGVAVAGGGGRVRAGRGAVGGAVRRAGDSYILLLKCCVINHITYRILCTIIICLWHALLHAICAILHTIRYHVPLF